MFQKNLLPAILLLAIGGTSFAQAPASGNWDKIKDTHTITVGYRPDGLPFSYEMEGSKKPVGYAIEICQALIARLQQSMGLPQLDIRYRAINGQTRFTDLASGDIDVDCSNTTNTKERRETRQVAFSIPYYMAGVRMLTLGSSKINDMEGLHNKRVITTKGTTSFKTLGSALSSGLKIAHSECLQHQDCFNAVQNGTADVWLMDDVLLAAYRAQAAKPEQFKIVGKLMSIEPLSLMMRESDARMKKVFDEEMRAMASNQEIARLYKKWFESPLPGKRFNLNTPMSYLLTDMLRYPSDKFDN
ncbi:amino acid ABC transporter substrate-binding protein [Comamonas odontotermitis]|uniref:amino acid ABC transporter substrate-binding protein n=1 Tax=Comamonas odontotermitis TaxID=379895 RepID=UPI001607E025|nr:amino acid ABC transporter substrate-binding protein [Comamonas odontotermitis]